MAVFPSFKLTEKGEELLNRSIGEGKTLTFTKFEIGNGDTPIDFRKQTGLVNKFYEFPILNTSIQKDQVLRIKGYFDNKSFSEDKQLKEIGVYVRLEGIDIDYLYSYTNAGDTGDIIPASSRGFYSRTLDVANYIGYATNITFNIEQLRDRYAFNTENEMKVASYLKAGDKVELWGNLVLGDKPTDEYIIQESGDIELSNGLFAKKVSFKYIAQTIEEMQKLALKVGDVVEVLGYYQSGDGAGHLRIIASEDDGSGVQLGNGLWANLIYDGYILVDWLGAKGDGVFDDSDIIQKALNFKEKMAIKFSVGKKYRITKTLSVRYGTRLYSDKKWFWQGLASGTTVINREKSPDGALMYIDTLDESITIFECESSVAFNGIDFLYANQNFATGNYSQLKKWNLCISGVGNISIQYALVIGAHNFLKSSGEHIYADNVYGYVTGTFFEVENCAEVCKFTNIHINSNVIRPTMDFVRMVARDCEVIGIKATEFDGIRIDNFFAIGQHKCFEFNGTNKLNNYLMNNIFVDFSGIMIYHNVDSTSRQVINNVWFIGGYGKENEGITRFIYCPKSSAKWNQVVSINNASIGKASSMSQWSSNDPNLIDGECAIENADFKWGCYYDVTQCTITGGFDYFSKNVFVLREEFYRGSYFIKNTNANHSETITDFTQITGAKSTADGNDYSGAYFTKTANEFGEEKTNDLYQILKAYNCRVKCLKEHSVWSGIKFSKVFRNPSSDYPFNIIVKAKEIGDSQGCWVNSNQYGKSGQAINKQFNWVKASGDFYYATISVTETNLEYLYVSVHLGSVGNVVELISVELVAGAQVLNIEPTLLSMANAINVARDYDEQLSKQPDLTYGNYLKSIDYQTFEIKDTLSAISAIETTKNEKCL